MPRLELNDREQWALRGLLGAQPSPGSPLPSREALEALSVLIPADEAGAVFQDGSYTLTDGIVLGGDTDGLELQTCTGGPYYLGIMHWSAHPRAAEACFGGLPHQWDSVAIGFRNGANCLVQVFLARRGPFTDRDLSMLRMLAPALARLTRERPTPALPASLTVQERRVLSHVAAGQSNAEIAADLFVAPSTIRKHLENSYRKLGVTSRGAAVARLQGRDLPDLDLRERLERLG